MKFLSLHIIINFFLIYNSLAQNQENSNLRLLIYPEIINNDSIKLCDSVVFFKAKICLTLKIDTIKNCDIKRVNGNKKAFSYKGNIYRKEQLFPITKYSDLLSFTILRFTVFTGLNLDITCVSAEGSCITQMQKTFMFNAYKYNKNPMLFIDNIEAINEHNKFLYMSLQGYLSPN